MAAFSGPQHRLSTSYPDPSTKVLKDTKASCRGLDRRILACKFFAGPLLIGKEKHFRSPSLRFFSILATFLIGSSLLRTAQAYHPQIRGAALPLDYSHRRQHLRWCSLNSGPRVDNNDLTERLSTHLRKNWSSHSSTPSRFRGQPRRTQKNRIPKYVSRPRMEWRKRR
jgi:hypothetical protein